ncbi:MAG: homoserine dehydrogenase [Anaerolineales bacterium]|nr:homoserine dehydrogenase [Anaerolineales bacterium]
MTHYKLAFLGFGNVGKALARLLMEKRADIHNHYGVTFSVTAIATGRHGSAIDPEGIDLQAALEVQDYTSLSRLTPPVDAFDFIQRCGADVLFENSPVNYETGQPAADHLRLALEMGMHALTANKGPVVHAFRELTDLAKARGRKFYFESTVMDGAPIFSLFRETLPAARLLSLRGVLNSTTNMILTRMEQGESFEQAVAYCQQIGIAETDPSGDIDGWDASVKVAALVTVMMGVPFKPQQVERQGIRAITKEKIELARSQGKRWKLVCSAIREGQQVKARVAPELVGPDSPMYGVNGTTSIVQFETDVLGLLSVVEADPGPHTTAYGLLADFLNAVR